MGRRRTKQRYLDSLKFRVASKQLKPKQAETFRLLFARCRTEADFEQVAQVMHQVSGGIQRATDRYARLMQDSPLEVEA